MFRKRKAVAAIVIQKAFKTEKKNLDRDHTIRFFAQFSGINRVKRRASP